MFTLHIVQIGAHKQAVTFHNYSPNKPILLFIHGGPGMPILSLMREIISQTGLGNECSIVFWEQRGVGKSFNKGIRTDEMKIENFVNDIIQLTQWICDKFKCNKPFLLGHSWGSLIALSAAQKRPDLFHTYIGVGQFVHMKQALQYGYTTVLKLAKTSQNTRILRSLRKLGPPPYDLRKFLKLRDYIFRSGFERRDGLSTPHQIIKNALFFTPEYNWVNKLNILIKPWFSLKCLWDEMEAFNGFEKISQLHLPVYFISGSYDLITPPSLIRTFAEQLSAYKGKKIIDFKDSAHYPFLEEPQRFREVIKSILLNSQ